ncbi:MAG: riboflavin synthase [Deltaproteobacteria bacterium]|nr:MAG: riboflavin synthase [Deltaproteobacteria bacterium]
MFTGIVEDVGRLVARRPRGRGHTLEIDCHLPLGPRPGAGPGERVKLGDSIAVMGACLTVEAMSPAGDRGGRIVAAAGAETLARTTLGRLPVGAALHLERALRLGERLDGHLVSGHVDAVGRVESCQPDQESVVVWVSAPDEVMRLVAEKGSICVDGVSLTVNELRADAFRVNLVPFTAEHTAAAGYRAGTAVNLEVDLLARYVARLVATSEPAGPERAREASGAARLTRERLVALGFAPPPRGGRD